MTKTASEIAANAIARAIVSNVKIEQPARLRLAIRLWHRFANPNIESFDDEPHKAEYLDAVDGLSSCLLLRLLISRMLQRKRPT